MISLYLRLFRALPAVMHPEGGMKKAWYIELASVVVLVLAVALAVA
jgi:hypothetical protein